MVCLAFANNKGGVGKTTVSVSIATELAKTKRVLLVDCDPQGNSTGSLVKSYDNEFADYLFSKCSLEEAIIPTDIENLSLLPTGAIDESNPTSLNQLRLYKTTIAMNRPNDIKKMTRLLEDKFDYCIFDTCPAFEQFEENILAACSEVIVVMIPDVFSVDGLSIFTKNLADFKDRKEIENPKFTKIILNSYNKSIAMHKQIVEKMANQDSFDCYIIPVDPAFRKAQGLQKPIQKMTKAEGEAKSETLDALSLLAENLGA